MIKKQAELPIGVFDSGVGGISVLAELIHQLPNESYLYYGDSGNAPYGIKAPEAIKKRSLEIAETLIEKGIKTLVVACNTATSVAIEALRQQFDMPIIGMEPALKPAIESNGRGTIFVMATPVTLKENKFNRLIDQFDQQCDIIKLPCPGLVEIIESQGARTPLLESYLEKIFKEYNVASAESIVLGCTHYVFIQGAIRALLGNNVTLIDGNQGTVNQVERLLQQAKLLQDTRTGTTRVTMYNSSRDQKLLSLSETLLKDRLTEFNFTGQLELSFEND